MNNVAVDIASDDRAEIGRERTLEVEQVLGANGLLMCLRKLRGRLLTDFRFDRLEANEAWTVKMTASIDDEPVATANVPSAPEPKRSSLPSTIYHGRGGLAPGVDPTSSRSMEDAADDDLFVTRQSGMCEASAGKQGGSRG